MEIDLLRASASRFDCLKKSTETIFENLKFSGTLRHILHEDVLDKDQSRKLVHWAKYSGLFDVIKVDDPPLKQGPSMDWLVAQTVSKYFLFWEDDITLARELDLDHVVKLMEENPDINQITFQKRKIMSRRRDWIKKEVDRSGQRLTTNPNWSNIPSLWRRDFIIPLWVCPSPKSPAASIEINRAVKQQKQGDGVKRGPDWMIDNVGNYFYGAVGTPRYVDHIQGFSARTGKDEEY